jgi:photosystem II stability/assembly factor-like uncharacterized protein
MKEYLKYSLLSAIIIFHITDSFCQSKFHNPLPAPYQLHGIFYVDSLYGWAVGEFGTIIKTTDGGESWKLQSSPVRSTLRKIYFADRNRGIIAGGDVGGPDFPAVLCTKNGGETWIDNNPNTTTSEGFNDLHFISENLGYIVGFTGAYKTTDMGQSWEFKGGPGWATTVFFVDEINGWIGTPVGNIFKTSDGGESWEQISNIHWTWNKDIKFFNSQIGWVVGEGLYSDYASIHKTTDGGFTWITQDSIWNRGYNEIEIFDSLNAIVVGKPGIVLYTDDGGINWYSEGTNDLGDYFDISMQGSRKWIVGGSEYFYPRMFASRETGFPWEKKYSTIVEGTINQIDFSDSLNGWCAGAEGILLRTSDGGSSWNNDELFAINFTSISVPTANDIFIAGDNGEFVKSTNGGQSWQVQQAFPNYSPIKIKFFSKYYGYSIAPYNIWFQKTTDGGNTWIDLTSNGYFTDFCFIDSLVGWALSGNSIGNGPLLKTTNGGESWIDTIEIGNINAFYFHDNNNGWIVSNYSMYKTTDGGNNWEFLSDIFDLTVLQFTFESNSKGYMLAVDYNYQDLYTIYQTLDGGLNWVPLRKYTYLKNIFVSESGRIWGVGEYAQIFSSDEVITSVEENQIKEEINTYLLSQNFPNPFNPITTIRYSIANHSNVTIKVYDLLGREVATLVNEEKPAGEYEVEFDGSSLTSGIYFYQLKDGNYTETKKMILLK